MIIIKPTAEEIPELLGLWKNQFDFHHSLDSKLLVAYSEELRHTIESYLKNAIEHDDPRLLVAKQDGLMVGFVTFKEEEAAYFDSAIRKYGTVIELYVAEVARTQGVGKELMKAAEQFFASKGLQHLKVCASSFNTNACDFYTHLGYVEREIVFFKEL